MMEPFLGAICAIAMISDVRLEFIYLIAGGSKLIRKFLSGLSCLMKLCLSRVSRSANQP
jgi:hypothetical protein